MMGRKDAPLLSSLKMRLLSIDASTSDVLQGEAASALTKHLKKFQDHEISVSKFDQATLFVTNYPPEYDEAKIRELFANVILRWF